MVGVRGGAAVGGPALVRGPRLPDLPVPDHVVDPEPAGHGAGPALAVLGAQPAGQGVADLELVGLARVEHPVERAALPVLLVAAAQDAVGVLAVRLLEQLGEGDRTGLVLAEAAEPALVRRGDVERGGQGPARLRHRDRGGVGRGGPEGQGDDGGRDGADRAGGDPTQRRSGRAGQGHAMLQTRRDLRPGQGVRTHSVIRSHESHEAHRMYEHHICFTRYHTPQADRGNYTPVLLRPRVRPSRPAQRRTASARADRLSAAPRRCARRRRPRRSRP